MTNWRDLHPDFTEEIQKYWENQGFTKEETKTWLAGGLSPYNPALATYLKKEGYTPHTYASFTNKSAQEWLNHFYPVNKRTKVTILNITRQGLTGELDLSEFSNLEQLTCGTNNLTNLIINNCSQLYHIDCPQNKLTSLNTSNLPKLRELNCWENNSLTNLNLSNNPLLTKFDCYSCNLTNLNLSNKQLLTYLRCYNNNLTDLSLLNQLNTNTLTYLHIANNKFPPSDLTVFSHLINLTELYCWRNPFIGSLAPLQSLSQLKTLDLDNTQINSGLEYLPASLAKFYCANCPELEKQLQGYAKRDENNITYYDYQEYKWLKKGFSKEEIKYWINWGLNMSEYELALYFKENNIQKDNFLKWKKHNFSNKEIQQWLSAGLLSEEVGFATYLKNEKKLASSEIDDNFTKLQAEYYHIDSNNEKLSVEIIEVIKCFGLGLEKHQLTFVQKSLLERLVPNQALRARYEEYGLCLDCHQPNAWGNNSVKKYWCQYCCNLTGNLTIDEFIQQQQSTANKGARLLEFIPHEEFTKIEYLAEGGFGTVYKARWNKENMINKKSVVLKSLHSSQNITNDFLREIANHKKVDSKNLIVKCSGISQDPKTKNYLLVMDYIKDGSLRQFLNKHYQQLSFNNKLEQLARIADGLKSIHNLDLVHRDFHAGNILNKKQGSGEKESIFCYITDFGLCRPANETDDGKVYGVLPYVAPEVLRGELYIQASDIYSFGIIAAEILTGLPPYHNIAHDADLTLQICQGLRPKFDTLIPQLLRDLINQCWDADPTKRPTASEITKTLRTWLNNKDNEFNKQAKEIEETKKLHQTLFSTPLNYQLHPSAIYTSRLLNFKNLPQPQNSQLINDQYYHLQNKTSELNSQLLKISELTAKTNSINANDLNRLLEKSKELTQELELIIATNPSLSEEAKKALIRVKELKVNELQTKNNTWQELKKIKTQKEQELEQLKTFLKNKMPTSAELNYFSSLKQELSQLEIAINQKSKELTQIINNVVINHYGDNIASERAIIMAGITSATGNISINQEKRSYSRRESYEEAGTEKKTKLELMLEESMEIDNQEFQTQIEQPPTK